MSLNDQSSFECPLCFEIYSLENYPVTFPCGHSCCKAHPEIKSCFACREPVIFRKLKPTYALRDAAAQYQLLLRAYESVLREKCTAAKASVEVDLLNVATASSEQQPKNILNLTAAEKLSFDWSLFDRQPHPDDNKIKIGAPCTSPGSNVESEKLSFDRSMFDNQLHHSGIKAQLGTSFTHPGSSTGDTVTPVIPSSLLLTQPTESSNGSDSIRSTPRKSIGPADEKKLSVEDLMLLFDHRSG